MRAAQPRSAPTASALKTCEHSLRARTDPPGALGACQFRETSGERSQRAAYLGGRSELPPSRSRDLDNASPGITRHGGSPSVTYRRKAEVRIWTGPDGRRSDSGVDGKVDPAFDDCGAPFIRCWLVSCAGRRGDCDESGDQRVKHVIGLDASFVHGCEIEPRTDIGLDPPDDLCVVVRAAAWLPPVLVFGPRLPTKLPSLLRDRSTSRPLPSRGAAHPMRRPTAAGATHSAWRPSPACPPTPRGQHELQAVGSPGRFRDE